ncbi:CHAT domain-containing protein [Scytonema sp. UIC 10036]|uniref:CHAT domain-containing protein n=1 Tax=Scytonema sp. UIC 10036 TaxID=2304196 RepID=UPI0012DA5D8F|nr:CHAT domain-containing tetratricopeptide repeat protein [Scytonema sp. UIC 10036]MUG93460.1 CHAT domain-containing protein [Scytonema sp. UIC 10036]
MQTISSAKKSVKPNAKLNLLILRLGTFISLTLLLSGIHKAAFSSRQEIITQNSISSTPQAISTDKLLQLGITQLREYKLRDAEKTFQQVLARRQKQQDSLGESEALNYLGEVYNSLGEYLEAQKALTPASAIYQKLNNRQGEGNVLDNLGETYQGLKEYSKALDTFQQALSIRRETKDKKGEGETLTNIGLVYIAQNQAQESVEPLQESLKIRQLFGEPTDNLQIETFIKRALEIREKIFGSNHPDVALSLNNLSSLYNVQGKPQESLKLLQRSLAIYEKAYGTKHTLVAINLSNQAWTYFLLGNNQKAVELTQKSLDITESIVGSQHPNFVNNLGMQAFIAVGNGEELKRSSEINRLTFSPLPGTKQEADAILPLLKEKGINVNLLTGSQATEDALKQVRSPSILHIATHGFFLTDEKIEVPDTLDLAVENRGITVKPGSSRRVSKNIENPLLRSGIALAGFNERRSGNGDGVLTALEASSLNLLGTKLVVLSACQTGVGKATNGEGVYGLRRAFVMAGTQSQLISLWDVSDLGTKELMVKYYRQLIKNEGRSEALRQTQLEMLKSQQYQHPFYWAAFIPSGDWTSAKLGQQR